MARACVPASRIPCTDTDSPMPQGTSTAQPAPVQPSPPQSLTPATQLHPSYNPGSKNLLAEPPSPGSLRPSLNKATSAHPILPLPKNSSLSAGSHARKINNPSSNALALGVP